MKTKNWNGELKLNHFKMTNFAKSIYKGNFKNMCQILAEKQNVAVVGIRFDEETIDLFNFMFRNLHNYS